MREFVFFPTGVHDDLDPAAGGQDARPGGTSDIYGAISSLKDFSPISYTTKLIKRLRNIQAWKKIVYSISQ